MRHERFDGVGRMVCVSDVGICSGRAVVLVTGMSGSGKSTALTALARAGHPVVDTDDAGWIVAASTAPGAEPVWDLDRVTARIDGHRAGWLFIAGCVTNQAAMYERFDAVVLLSAPIHLLQQRVSDRTNPYGATPDDREKIAADHAEFEPWLRTGATHEIVTTGSVTDLVDELERIAAGIAC